MSCCVSYCYKQVVAEEELLKADSKSDNQEAELIILDEFAVLCRDLYAFYPMLIRYVDNNRYKKSRGDSLLFQELDSSNPNVKSLLSIEGPGGLKSLMQTPLSSSEWWRRSSSSGANPM